MWHLCREMSEEDYFITDFLMKNGIVIGLAVPFLLSVVDVI